MVPIINYMKKCISWSILPDELKIVEIYPVYKNEDINSLIRNVLKWSETF